MKRIIFIFLFVFVYGNLFAYEQFNEFFGIKRGMNKTDVKKLAEAENWLLLSETDSELRYWLSFNRFCEGFFGVSVPQICIFFNNGVSGFIIATDTEDEETVNQIIEKLDEKYGLEYVGIYKNHFLFWKMNQDGNILLSWEVSRNMLTQEISEFAQFTVNCYYNYNQEEK